MKFQLSLFLLVALHLSPNPRTFSQPQSQPRPVVRTGIDVLIEHNFSILKGKRIGLITNPSGVSNTLQSTADIFARAKEFKLVALFGPEHGVRGDVAAGRLMESSLDSATGVPVFSLYGKTTKPTRDMLKGIDVLVYDIQDIGLRSYTYINTLAGAMEAAAENDVEFIVLDRPDPLTGNRIEGCVLDPKFKSYVGMFPIPYIYGMTCGELAALLIGEGWLAGGRKCRLTVVNMEGWKRSMWWDETGLQWIPTSPHIPTSETVMYCAMTGIIGELGSVSVGVGYTLPFKVVSAPWINADELANTLNAQKLPGVHFRPVHFTPFYATMQGKECHGVQIHVTDREKITPVNDELYILEALGHLYPTRNVFDLSEQSRVAMFDKVTGTDDVRLALRKKIPAGTIITGWRKNIDEFLAVRKKYLRYE